MEIKTLKIKSSHPSQGDFVVINEEDFDSTKHKLHVEGNQTGKAIAESPSETPVIEQDTEAPKRGRPYKDVI